jgi:hypothetical protein
MRRPPSPSYSSYRRAILVRALLALALAAVAALGLLADTPSRVRDVPAGGCYCGCCESHARGGCVKMCELPKYASRWWATTCAKPRVQHPAVHSDAGPRLRRPARAEHARL